MANFVFSGSISEAVDQVTTYAAVGAIAGSTIVSNSTYGLAMLTNPPTNADSITLRKVNISPNMVNNIDAATDTVQVWGGITAFTSSVGAVQVLSGLSTSPVNGAYSTGSHGQFMIGPDYTLTEQRQFTALLPSTQGQQGSDLAQDPWIKFDLLDGEEIEIAPGYSFVIGAPNGSNSQYWLFQIGMVWDE